MKIELDDATLAEIMSSAKGLAIKEIMKNFNALQVAAEIRNAATKEAGAIIAELLMKDPRVLEAVHRATQSVESRVNDKLSKTLAKGITIKFTDEGLK